MKKPELTEGEWRIDKPNPLTHAVRYITSNDVEIATLYGVGEDYQPNAINDLKAISAVPEMIDALMEALIELETHDENGVPVEHDVMDKCKQALIKAGCQ